MGKERYPHCRNGNSLTSSVFHIWPRDETSIVWLANHWELIKTFSFEMLKKHLTKKVRQSFILKWRKDAADTIPIFICALSMLEIIADFYISFWGEGQSNPNSTPQNPLDCIAKPSLQQLASRIIDAMRTPYIHRSLTKDLIKRALAKEVSIRSSFSASKPGPRRPD